MSDNHEYNLLRELRTDLVGVVLGKIQSGRMKLSLSNKVPEPEIDSPKAKYEVEDMLNNPYMNRDEVALAMDIFKPVVPEEMELPVVVTIHGGGLVVGDRGMSRTYCRALASRGYLVFSVEYRLAPRASVCEQLDDVCAGMDFVGRRLVDFNVDLTRIFLTAESAGAYLATYVAAMKKSKKLQKAIGYKPTNMIFKALGLHCGMFYTDREDPIGWFLADQIYGDKIYDEDFRQYLDPEHNEIIDNLPPVFLTTSRGDFLNNYTIMYHNALKKAGCKSHIMYFGSKDDGHAFVAADANRADSIKAIDRMVDWFEEQARQDKEEKKRHLTEKRLLNKIESRIESGKITEQKSWEFIKELNSYAKNRLDNIAFVDGEGEYTYRKFFDRWDQYARVFSGLGITGGNNSRVGMTGSPSQEASAAFYALNMTGASVSMMPESDVMDENVFKLMIEQEGITDLILTDVVADANLVRRIVEGKDSLGIANIIILCPPASGKYVPNKAKDAARSRRNSYKSIKDIFVMDDLIPVYKETEIIYADDSCDDAALIVHTSDIVNGIHKPVPMSDRGLNAAVSRLFKIKSYRDYIGRGVLCQNMDYSGACSAVDMMHLPLAFGGKIIALPYAGSGSLFRKAVANERSNILFASPHIFNKWSKKSVKFDMSGLEMIVLGGAYISEEDKKQCNDFLKKSGAPVRAAVCYSLPEAGAACIMSSPERKDNAIGYPLPGVRIKIRDQETGTFFDLSDGSSTGILYIASASVSSGCIGDHVYVETEEIEGHQYINTHDLVEVGEYGALRCLGRAD